MALEVTSKSYTVHNGGSNSFLLANAGQLVVDKVVFVCDFDFTSTSSTPVIIYDANSLQVVGTTWGDLGFVVGDTVNLSCTMLVDDIVADTQFTITLSSSPMTISDINGDIMSFTANISVLPGSEYMLGVMLPLQGRNTAMSIVNTSRSAPQQVEIQHALRPNSAGTGVESLIDGSVSRFIFDNVNSLGVSSIATGYQIGNKSGGAYIASQLKRLSDTGGNKTYEARFEYFMPDITDNTLDKPTWFEDVEAIKPSYSFICKSQTNNPNSALSGTYSPQSGNTGWYNEAHNGGVNDFTIQSVLLTVGGAPVSAIDYSQPTHVKATITSTTNFQNGAEAKFSFLPASDDFKNKPESHHELTYTSYSNVSNNHAWGVNGREMVLDGMTVDVSTSNTIIIEFNLTPNGAFTTYFESLGASDRLIRLSASVQKTGATNNTNNNVSLILFEGLAEVAPLPDTPFDGVLQKGFISHQFDLTSVPSVTYEGCTEDDMIYVSKLSFLKNTAWERLRMNVDIVRTSDGARFTLEGQSIDLQSIPMVGGVIQINSTQQLNQKLDGNDRNVIKLTLGTIGATHYEVDLNWSMLVNWRYWIEQSNAFIEFYDLSLPQNGLNAEWMRYLRGSGYTIEVKCVLELDGLGYFWTSPFTLQDYDDWDGVSTFTYFDSVGVQKPSLVSGEVMKVRCDHVLNSGMWTAGDVWGWIATRPTEMEQRKQMSSIWNWTSQNMPLLPKNGETKATIDVVTTNTPNDTARIECLIDTSMIDVANVTMVSRVHSPTVEGCKHPIDYMFDYVLASKEVGETFVEAFFRLHDATGGIFYTDTVCCPPCGNRFMIGNLTSVYANGRGGDCCYIGSDGIAHATLPPCSDTSLLSYSALLTVLTPGTLTGRNIAILNGQYGVDDFMVLRANLLKITNQIERDTFAIVIADNVMEYSCSKQYITWLP